jgi:hypothetical protein
VDTSFEYLCKSMDTQSPVEAEKNVMLCAGMELTPIFTSDVEANEKNYNSNFHKEHEAPVLEVPTEGP